MIILIACLFVSRCLIALASDDQAVPRSADLLSRYIRHKSVTGSERMAGLFFSTVARQKGFHVEVLTDEPDSYNFTASLYPLESGKPNIVFLNHIDVVPAVSVDEFTYPPFEGVIADGKVWGRGAIDNKGMAVMQLLAMQYYVDLATETDLPFNITMLSVSGEETGGEKGAKIIVSEFFDLLNPVVVYGEGGSGVPDVLVREPDRKLFGISIAFKRSLWVELTLAMTTSGHGSIPPSSYVVQDKIQALNRLTERNRRITFSESTRNMFYELGRVEGGMRGLALRNLRLFRPFVVPAMRREEMIFALITNTITITGINTPEGPPNLIPQEITAILDCRLLPETDTGKFLEKIRRSLVNSDVDIRVIKEAVHAPPTQPDEFYDYMKEALQRVYHGAGVIPILAPASNDNNYFRSQGIPTYGILPVYLPVYLLETIHNVDERLPVDDLEKGVEVYRQLIAVLIESEYGEVTNNSSAE